VRRLTVTLALLAALFALPMVASADDGSGMRCPDPYIEQIYGDTAR
jgi:hypothetical protein